MPSDPSLPLSFLLPLLNLQSQQLARRQSQDTQDASLLFSTVVCAVLSEEELGEGGGKKSLGDIDFQLHPHAGFTQISSGMCIFLFLLFCVWKINVRPLFFHGRRKKETPHSVAGKAEKGEEERNRDEIPLRVSLHF